MSDLQLKIGAMRYKDSNGEWHEANPGTVFFSTVTMLATQYYDGYSWRLIFIDGDDEE